MFIAQLTLPCPRLQTTPQPETKNTTTSPSDFLFGVPPQFKRLIGKQNKVNNFTKRLFVLCLYYKPQKLTEFAYLKNKTNFI